jgi:hypothetical protein
VAARPVKQGHAVTTLSVYGEDEHRLAIDLDVWVILMDDVGVLQLVEAECNGQQLFICELCCLRFLPGFWRETASALFVMTVYVTLQSTPNRICTSCCLFRLLCLTGLGSLVPCPAEAWWSLAIHKGAFCSSGTTHCCLSPEQHRCLMPNNRRRGRTSESDQANKLT